VASRWRRLTAAPTTGTWSRGDIAWNTNPTSTSSPVGWVCITAGTPGTWAAFGAPNASSGGSGSGPALSDAAPQALGTAAAGTSEDASRADHVHAHGNQAAGGSMHAAATTSVAGFMSATDKTKLDGVATGATANTLAVGSTAPGNVTKAAASAGSSAEAARVDHKHDITTAAAVANPPGTANAEGSATSLARSDHTHALAAFGTGAGTFAEGNDSRLSNDRTASGIRTATTVVSVSSATAPTNGQVLQATSSTAAAWATIGSGGGTGMSGSVRLAPHFATANLTSTKSLTSGWTFAVYMGRLQTAASSVSVRLRMTTGSATITWAEVAIAKGPVVAGAGTNLTRLGFTDASAIMNSVGLKTVTVALTGAAVGDDIWVLIGNAATTLGVVRAQSIADDIQTGSQVAANVRPSTMASSTAFAVEAASTLAMWCAVIL